MKTHPNAHIAAFRPSVRVQRTLGGSRCPDGIDG
jgi:hypothetical protein